MLLGIRKLQNEVIKMLKKFFHSINVLVNIRRDLLLVKDSVP